jgi:myosin heavy subunit
MKFLNLVVSIFLCTALWGQSNAPKLGEQEVKDSDRVYFRNKTNKKAAEETKALHESIGKRLAELAKEKPDQLQSYQGVRVVRVPTKEKGKFAADILYLDDETKFGHIHSIQRIVSGYIQKAFDYSESESDLLATYVLYYNAMHRGKLSYFNSKYTSDIQKRISSKSVGIAVDYKDWPGRTEIVIPVEKNILKEFNRDVTLDELEEQVGKVIDDKKGGEEDKNKFEELKKEKAKEEKEKLLDKKQEVANLDDLLNDKKKSIEDKLKELKKNPEENKDKITKLENDAKKIDKEKENLEKTKQDLKEKEEKITGKKIEPTETVTTKEKSKEEPKAKSTESASEEPAKKEETVASLPPKSKEEPKVEEKKKEETTKDVSKLEKDLADKTKELEAKKEEDRKKAENSQNVVDGKILLIKPVTYIEGQCNNELHVLDPNKDDFVTKSDYNKICGKVFKDFGGNILVIGFKDNKDQIQLVLLSKKDLKPAGNSGDVYVYNKTPLEIMDDHLYAIEFDDGKYYLSRFDKNLKRVLRSSEEITSDATITFYGKKVYLSGKNENGVMEFKIFNKEDLKLIKKAKTQA